MKKALWNAEFSGGDWNCLDTTPGDSVYSYVERYAARGAVLDLGCGSGSTATELNPAAYRSYVGVDVSDVAIAKAIKRTEEINRSQSTRFVQADFFDYEPDAEFNVILFRDSIYYVPVSKVLPMLKRYSQHLSQTGVFIVRMWGGGTGEKEKAVIDIIKESFAVVEEYCSQQPQVAIIVFH